MRGRISSADDAVVFDCVVGDIEDCAGSNCGFTAAGVGAGAGYEREL